VCWCFATKLNCSLRRVCKLTCFLLSKGWTAIEDCIVWHSQTCHPLLGVPLPWVGQRRRGVTHLKGCLLVSERGLRCCSMNSCLQFNYPWGPSPAYYEMLFSISTVRKERKTWLFFFFFGDSIKLFSFFSLLVDCPNCWISDLTVMLFKRAGITLETRTSYGDFTHSTGMSSL